MLVKVKITGHGVLETGGEIEDDEDLESVDQELEGMPIPHYEVEDLDEFFEVYEFDDSEQDAIREKSRDHRLFVYQDGSVLWQDGDILCDPADELLDIDSFRREAERSGAELVD